MGIGFMNYSWVKKTVLLQWNEISIIIILLSVSSTKYKIITIKIPDLDREQALNYVGHFDTDFNAL